jgi:hypothetical protein
MQLTSSIAFTLSTRDQIAAGPLGIMVSTGVIMDDLARSIMTVRQCHLTQERETMTADQPKGTWMQFKGDLKNKWGKFTDDGL